MKLIFLFVMFFILTLHYCTYAIADERHLDIGGTEILLNETIEQVNAKAKDGNLLIVRAPDTKWYSIQNDESLIIGRLLIDGGVVRQIYSYVYLGTSQKEMFNIFYEELARTLEDTGHWPLVTLISQAENQPIKKIQIGSEGGIILSLELTETDEKSSVRLIKSIIEN